MPDALTQPHPHLLSTVVPKFLLYAEIELRFAKQTIEKYQDSLRQVARMIEDKSVTSYSKDDLRLLKSKMLARQHSVSRQVGILAAFKRMLLFCRDELGLPVLDPALITLPKRPRREVSYLTVEEVQSFVDAINLTTKDGKVHLAGLRFRALVETLLGSAMRIGEVLSLDRGRIDFAAREAKIVGKGNKERIVFFTDRAISWLKRYLDTRTDNHQALFVTINGRSRLGRPDIWRPFARYCRRAGINKRVTPHLLRHTAATQLLFNGCPIGHIKEILGHERLETTCRYYLGLDHRAAKQAHERFLMYARSEETQSAS